MISIGTSIAIVATLISMVRLTQIAHKHHNRLQPRTLSELAAAQDRLLGYFRTTLIICGTLFAAVYGFVAPHLGYWLALTVAWATVIVGNMLAAFIPARDSTRRLHETCAQLMAAGMIALSYVFWLSLPAPYAHIELCIAIVASVLAVGTILDRPRFIWYELPFIYLSHISIVIAAIEVGRVSGHWL